MRDFVALSRLLPQLSGSTHGSSLGEGMSGVCQVRDVTGQLHAGTLLTMLALALCALLQRYLRCDTS